MHAIGGGDGRNQELYAGLCYTRAKREIDGHMDANGQWHAAVAEWREVLGAEGVSTEAKVLARYARTTQPEGTRPRGILYPVAREQVQSVVRIASRYGIVVYPISRGKNWGYGDACAPTDGAVIVDLSRMNRILEINSELAYAVIEPGVTQQQLFEVVRREAPGFWLDCTGAGGGASVVGNILERGFGHTPYGDHVRTTCGMEVVLPDGKVLHTGFGHFPEAKTAHVYPYGVGPILDGLFMQSNLGIVTQLGLWLYPTPEAFRFFFIKVDREEDLAPLIEALRPLRMRGILNSAVHIGNDLRIISSLRRYPWEEMNGATPLSESMRARLRRETGVGAWNVSGALAGTHAQVRGAARAVRRAAGPLGKVVFVNDLKLALGQRAIAILRHFGIGGRLARQLAALEPNYGLLKGIPTDEPLRGTQWRLRGQPSDALLDPLEARCGLLWMSPVVPMRGADADEVIRMVTPLYARHGFELLATFTMLNERSMVAILNMCFDKDNPEETAAASACYDAVMHALTTAGYPPYRVGAQGLPGLAIEGDTFWEVAGTIKRALDPADILARGRYIPPLR